LERSVSFRLHPNRTGVIEMCLKVCLGALQFKKKLLHFTNFIIFFQLHFTNLRKTASWKEGRAITGGFCSAHCQAVIVLALEHLGALYIF